MPSTASPAWRPIPPSAAGNGSPSSPAWRTGPSWSQRLIKAVLRAGWPFSIECYLPEQPTEAAERKYLQRHLVREGKIHDLAVPGCLKQGHLHAHVFVDPFLPDQHLPDGQFSHPPRHADGDPGQCAGLCRALRRAVLSLALRRSRHAALLGPAAAPLLHRGAQGPLFPRAVRVEAFCSTRISRRARPTGSCGRPSRGASARARIPATTPCRAAGPPISPAAERFWS